jgi:hypothetical protein
MTWNEVAKTFSGLRDLIGAVPKPASWRGNHGEALKALILADEQKLEPGLNAKLEAAILGLAWPPPLSDSERWFVVQRLTYAIEICKREAEAGVPLPEDKIDPVVGRLLYWTDEQREIWRRAFAKMDMTGKWN